jgi:hypothetical protein
MNPDIPDVYTEEIKPSGAPVLGIGTGTVGLVGKFLSGEINKPVRIGTWDQFVSLYGGLVIGSAAYDTFFVLKNLAPAMVIVRVEGTHASKTIKDRAGTPADKLKLTALIDGEFANYAAGPPKLGIEAIIDDGTITNTFSLVLNYYYAEKGEQKTYTETYDNLAIDPVAARYFVTIINAASFLVSAEDLAPTALTLPTNLPGKETYTLTGGVEPDYTGTSSPEGIDIFEKDDDINVVIADTDDSAVRSLLIDHCVTQKDRQTVLNTPQFMESADIDEIGDALDTDRATIPGEWRIAYDPVMKVSRSFRPAPFRAGVLARLDPYLSPSNNLEYGVLDIERLLSRADLVTHQNHKVSPTYRWGTRGIRVRNGINCSSDVNLSQVYRRRMADFIIESIQDNSGWAVSLPITPKKKDAVIASITNWFGTVKTAGWIEGFYCKYISTKADEAARKEIYHYGAKLWNVGDFVIFQAEIGPNIIIISEIA